MNDPPQQDLAPSPPVQAAMAAVDVSDFPAVVDTYESPLLRYVLNLTQCRREQAEDIVQEVFLRLHRQVRKPGKTNIEDLSSWLFKVAHNLAIDAVLVVVLTAAPRAGRRWQHLHQTLSGHDNDRETNDVVVEEAPRLPGTTSGDPLEQADEP